ncbi:MAG: hypothetical protein ABR953_04675 [Candidatus Acidiferrales bacterium]|jgi:GTP cyclohydrolase II
MKRKKQTGKVRVVAKAALPTRFGRFTIAGIRGGQSEEAVAIQHGRLRPGKAPLVRVHSQCLTGSVLRSISLPFLDAKRDVSNVECKEARHANM